MEIRDAPPAVGGYRLAQRLLGSSKATVHPYRRTEDAPPDAPRGKLGDRGYLGMFVTVTAADERNVREGGN